MGREDDEVGWQTGSDEEGEEGDALAEGAPSMGKQGALRERGKVDEEGWESSDDDQTDEECDALGDTDYEETCAALTSLVRTVFAAGHETAPPAKRPLHELPSPAPCQNCGCELKGLGMKTLNGKVQLHCGCGQRQNLVRAFARHGLPAVHTAAPPTALASTATCHVRRRSPVPTYMHIALRQVT